MKNKFCFILIICLMFTIGAIAECATPTDLGEDIGPTIEPFELTPTPAPTETPTPTPTPTPVVTPCPPPEVYIYIHASENPKEGDIINITSKLINGEYWNYRYQWVYSKDGVNWQDIEGATNDTYTFTLTNENRNYSYALAVYYKSLEDN